MDHQDWNQVVWTKKAPTSTKEAHARGIEVAVRSRQDSSTHGQQMAKIDRTEIGTHAKVSSETANAIMKGRSDKKYTQKYLAQLINEKLEVVANYETRKTIPNIQIILKMERVLGIHLVGKNIGTLKDSSFKSKK